MKALVLAAGYGTRLYPLTEEYPKALLPLKNKPLINYIVRKLEKINAIDKIIIVSNNKFFNQFKNWRRKFSFKKELKIINDETNNPQERRGAIGDVIFAIERLDIHDDLLIIGGDNFCSLSLKRFINFARRRNSCCIALFDIKNKEKAKRFGVVKIDKNFRLRQFQEKPINPLSTLVATCIYYFPKESLSLFFAYRGAYVGKKDATGYYVGWLSKKVPIYGFRFTGLWFDIGHLDTYKKLQKLF